MRTWICSRRRETRKRLGACAVHMKMGVCYLSFTVTICVFMAVVERTTEGFCSGNLAISGMIFFSLVPIFWRVLPARVDGSDELLGRDVPARRVCDRRQRLLGV